MTARSVIVSGARTPFGKFGGALTPLEAVDLGSIAIKGAIERAEISLEVIDEVIMGMVLQGGAGQVPSRQAAVKAGLPWEVKSETINKVCASGLRSVTLADQIIRAGDGDILIAGGMESMSNAPFILPNARWGQRMGNGQVVDLMQHDGLTCAFHDVPMVIHGNTVAAEYEVPRIEQDRWAYRSHQRAIAAIDQGLFEEEIVPVSIPQRKGNPLIVTTDEGPRRDTSLEKLGQLKPVFDPNGTITAGNAPSVNDGAAAFVVMSEQRTQEMGKKPLATILGHTAIGADAPYIATAPGIAINQLLQKMNLTVSDIDLFEVNEAFAAVTLISGGLVGWNEEKVNVNGGAIALGHPIGASGARILLTLIYELKRRGGGLGIAAICSGAAQGDAILVQVD